MRIVVTRKKTQNGTRTTYRYTGGHPTYAILDRISIVMSQHNLARGVFTVLGETIKREG